MINGLYRWFCLILAVAAHNMKPSSYLMATQVSVGSAPSLQTNGTPKKKTNGRVFGYIPIHAALFLHRMMCFGEGYVENGPGRGSSFA
jgi:hypothetical protein